MERPYGLCDRQARTQEALLAASRVHRNPAGTLPDNALAGLNPDIRSRPHDRFRRPVRPRAAEADGPSALRLDHDPRRGPSSAGTELVLHLTSDSPIDRRVRTVRLGGDHGQSGIRLFADVHMQRHLAEEWNAEPLGLVPRAAMAEYVRAAAAFRAHEIAHVLDDAEHRHIDTPEHGDATPGV